MYFVILGGIAAVLLVLWYRQAGAKARRKADSEQVNRKLREDRLDRALANPLHNGAEHAVQNAARVEYLPGQQDALPGSVLRLTEKDGEAERTYLFAESQRFFLAAHNGHPAVLQAFDEQYTVECEIFRRQQGWYARILQGGTAHLVRGRHTTALDTRGIRLAHGDRVELPFGVYTIEFLETGKKKGGA